MSDTIKKQISIGVEDFKEIIVKDGYFVDKTLMIKKLIEEQCEGNFVYPSAALRQDAESVYDPPLL